MWRKGVVRGLLARPAFPRLDREVMRSMLDVILADGGWSASAQRRASAWLSDPDILRSDAGTLPTRWLKAVLGGIEASIEEHALGDETQVDPELRECLDALRAELLSREGTGR